MKTKSKTVTIRVTRLDIIRGAIGSATSCPVALACVRRLNHKVYVHGDDAIELDGDGNVFCPKAVERFVERFDVRKPVKPFTFKLKLTPEVRDFLHM